MRKCLVICCIFFCCAGWSQQKTATDPAGLAKELTSNHESEFEKVRAIFEWITLNVEYQVRQVKRLKSPYVFPEEDTGELKSLDERVALQVLHNKTAVCDGYSRLFQTLCMHAGIQAELVTGYARTTGYRINERFRSNHTWNAVRIDNEWKLLDVTWGSRDYFLPDPKKFIDEHYPDDIRWTLLMDPPLLPEFRFSPYKHRAFAKYNIQRFTPAKGIISARPGETITIELQSRDVYKDGQIYAEPFEDTSLYVTTSSALLVPENYKSNRIIYRYTVTDPSVQWLYILYHNDIILRYSLIVLPEEK